MQAVTDVKLARLVTKYLNQYHVILFIKWYAEFFAILSLRANTKTMT